MKRWLKRGGIVFGVLALLIVAFYLEENWRGARLWAQTKVEYEAKGFHFDPKSLIPPPVPDEQNFAKSEIWQRIVAASDYKKKEHPESALINAIRAINKSKRNSSEQAWRLGRKLEAAPASAFEGTSDELKLLYFEGQKRFYQLNYTLDLQKLPFTKPLSTPPPDLMFALREHALTSLEVHRPSEAMSDLLLATKLTAATHNLPTLVATILTDSFSRVAVLPVLWQGLESHSWSDAELLELQRNIASLDLLGSLNRSLFNEMPLLVIPINNLLKDRKFHSYSLPFREEVNLGKLSLPFVIPSGWFDIANANATKIMTLQILPLISKDAHRIYFEKLPQIEALESSLDRSFFISDRVLSTLALAASSSMRPIGNTQSYLDLAQVACGLERYRLASGKYPATLAELEPKFIDRVPHDLCNGEPLHYRVEADGNYTLYSVGFNGVDDGGKVVMKKESAAMIDPKQGDWVWPRSKQ